MTKVFYLGLGALIGAGLAAWYFKTHALQLTAGGIAEKLGASPSTVQTVEGIANAVQGIGN